MVYTAYSLNGEWEMDYSEEVYLSEENPFKNRVIEEDLAGTEPEGMDGSIVDGAVPGYWEDMVDKFRYTPFFCKLRINPEYGIQSYPIAGNPPDMALPNIMGNFFYRRSISLDAAVNDTAIRFEGVMNSVSVWVNDKFLGRHCGYSTPFEINIPDGLLKKGENDIVFSVSNIRLAGYDGEDISGLTSRAANEYSGGITGDVELRIYNSPLRDISVIVNEKNAVVNIDSVKETEYKWQLADDEEIICSGIAVNEFEFNTESLEKWSPENAKLYMLRISCESGFIERKIGIRKIGTSGKKITLNGSPYLLRGACEHGYYPETVHPAHDSEFYRKVIKKLKELGFNYIRFHTYVPEEEYMTAADELGMLLQVECPNNTTVAEWEQIVRFCRKHTSAVIYCCGNELLIDDKFIKHLNECADIVHKLTDALFAPLSAMRGLEYFWCEPNQEHLLCDKPFRHHPARFEAVGKFSDIYCSYPNGAHSYFSLDGTPDEVDECGAVYNRPRLSHEICIDGTYTDLSVKDRYNGLRIGKTDMFSSIERHLSEKGVLDKAPLYFRNSSEWQRRIRKYCFEKVRMSKSIAGYDFLGPIDTHWHTFGYDVGMMNEFYELKPGESVRNVLRYNSETVLLADIAKNTNYESDSDFSCGIYISSYKKDGVKNAELDIKLFAGGELVASDSVSVKGVKCGELSEMFEFSAELPYIEKPREMLLRAELSGDGIYAENEWELYLYPKVKSLDAGDTVVSYGMKEEELVQLLENGKDVLILGAEPFQSIPTSFRISLAGRTSGNVATVIYDHPVMQKLPNGGFCGWQFVNLMEGGKAICFGCDSVPFEPITEVVSTHKFVIKQAAMFEFSALNGRLFVCGFNFKNTDACSKWLKNEILGYMHSNKFSPKNHINRSELLSLINTSVRKAEINKNVAFNVNDKTAVRKNKRL